MYKIQRNSEICLEWRRALEGQCSICQSLVFIDDPKTGDTICTNCGCVVADKKIDQGQEWRSFDRSQENSKARTGLPISPLIPDKGLTTRIGTMKSGTPGQLEVAGRLKKTNQRNRGSNLERNLRRGFDIMKMISAALGISDSGRNRSAMIYRKAVEMKLSRGRPMDALVCACMFAGCKENATPKPLDSFTRYGDERQIKNCIALLVDQMKLNILASKPKDFVEEIADKGCLSAKARINAYKILGRLKELGFTISRASRDPRGLVAAALYIGCKASKDKTDQIQTQRDLACYAGLTEVTVRNRIRDIKKELIIKMPEIPNERIEEVCIT